MGTLEADAKGFTRINGKPSKWHWHAVQGALASVQERGVTVLYAPDAAAVPAMVAMLAARDRSTKRLQPPRDALFLSPAETLLTALPTIGIATAERLLHSTGGNLAWALSSVTDPSIDVGINDEQRGKIRAVFGLTGDEIIAVHLKGANDA